MTTEDNVALHKRFEVLKGAEEQKNNLIEELLYRMDQLTKDHQKAKFDLARESYFNREVQQKEISLQDEVRKYKNLMDRDAFILVLIDGDGMIFDDKFISRGEAGGKDAARLLWKSVTDHLDQNSVKVPSDYKIVTRIYANLKGLGDVCQRSGVIDRSEVLEDFARGFTGSKQLFDFVDVGMGKDRADDKISEIFKLHLYDCHCRQILFGCSHDNGYARLLEDIADSTILDNITLLEGVPFEKELAQLRSKYQTTRFEGLFRTSKINVYPKNQLDFTARPRTNGSPLSSSDLQSQQQPSQKSSSLPRQPPASPVVSHTLNPLASTWATAAMTAPLPTASSPPISQPLHNPKQQVLRNRYGQRLDPIVKYDPNELKRIKTLKLCNIHYLRKDCPFDPCEHDHNYKLNKNELATLRFLSRFIPCHFGSECDDISCIHGHVCPNGVDGRKDCRFGDTCRFEREQHGIDKTPVKVLKVGGK